MPTLNKKKPEPMVSGGKLNVLLRCDGNLHIGLGHVYRCVAMAEMLKENFNCIFVLSHLSNFEKVIPSEYQIITLDKEVSLQNEAGWINENYTVQSTAVVLDGYHFDSAYQKKIKEFNFKFVYVDDLQNELMYADAVINHAPGIDPKAYKKSSVTNLYLGTDFVLLRKHFLQLAKSPHNSYSPVSSMLISMGGSDEHNITLKMAKTLLNIEKIKEVNIIVGAAFKHKKALDDLISNSGKKIKMHANLSELKMAELLKGCDAVVVPCSTICLESIAANKPIFAGFSANNQFNLYTWFKNNRIIFNLNDLQNISETQIKNIVEEKISNPSEINDMLLLQKKLIDGNSGFRILSIFKSLFNEN
jgi:UDP-2,4-diacetamido-2,4,6-trideoxy-beta-L-altropyranose hydrolase